MNNNDWFYKPTYYGASHSAPTTEKWFDTPPIGGGEPHFPCVRSPELPSLAAPAVDFGYIPPGVKLLPYDPTPYSDFMDW